MPEWKWFVSLSSELFSQASCGTFKQALVLWSRMKIYNLRRFSKPEFLRRVAPELLPAFLHRFPGFNIELKDDGTIDYDKLGRQLASPTGKIDAGMFDVLALIDEMSADRNFDLLQDTVGNKPYATKLGDDASAADLALLLWLHEPRKLEQLHAKFSGKAPRSFVYFYGESIVSEKKGWDYLWVRYADDLEDGETLVKKPIAAYVEKVYERKDFGLLGIGR